VGCGKGEATLTTVGRGKGDNMKDPVPTANKKGPLTSVKKVKGHAAYTPATKGGQRCIAIACSSKKKVSLFLGLHVQGALPSIGPGVPGA